MTEASIRSNPHSSPVAINPLRTNRFMNGPDIPESKIPWKRKGVEYQYGIFGLHNEIKDFIAYIKPTREEQWVRELVIARVQSIIYQLWPCCRIEVCGSFKTNLYLPSSDIDMVIFGNWEVLPLEKLKNHLESSGLTSSIKVLSRATLDISFNMTNSIRAVCLIKDYIDAHPCLPHLVLVLKQFLFQRDLNEVWTGGLGSYALILMCVSFLQHNTNSGVSTEDVNLGTILVEFLELYGRRFNYVYAGIRVRSGGSYVPKDKMYKFTEFLCIEDPLDPALHPSFITNPRPGSTASISTSVIHPNSSVQILTPNQNNGCSAGLNPPVVLYNSNLLNSINAVSGTQLLPLPPNLHIQSHPQSRIIPPGSNLSTNPLCTYSGFYPSQHIQIQPTVPTNSSIPIVTVCPNGTLLTSIYQPSSSIHTDQYHQRSCDDGEEEEDDDISEKVSTSVANVPAPETSFNKNAVFKLPNKETTGEDSSQPSSDDYNRLSSSQTSAHEDATTSGSNTGHQSTNFNDSVGVNQNFKRSRRYSRRQTNNNNVYSEIMDQSNSVKSMNSIANDPSVITNESNTNIPELADRLGSSSDDEIETNLTKSSANIPVINTDKSYTNSPVFHKSASQSGIPSGNPIGIKRKRLARKPRAQRRSQLN